MPRNCEPVVYPFDIDDPDFALSRLFGILSRRPKAIFLDGGGERQFPEGVNRYSFLASDPIDQFVVYDDHPFDFGQLRPWMSRFVSSGVVGLPPFQGGMAGVLSYEFHRRLEHVAGPQINDFVVPQVAMFVYDFVFAIDHQLRRGWLICQGWPHSDPAAWRRRAEFRLAEVLSWIETDAGEPIPGTDDFAQPLPHVQPQSAMNRIEGSLEVYSNFSPTQFLEMVRRGVNYIRAGDIFQVNLAQRLLVPARCPSPELYWEMRTVNPAPFSGYLDLGDAQLISASPERLISHRQAILETRPIKGTRRHTQIPEVDLDLCRDLMSSEKDRAENIMIVDLMRNDLSRVSDPDSVRVAKLCGIEKFQDVVHLVSVIQSRLSPGQDTLNVLQCLFPGGSITGAPKIRAMQIISELEGTARGLYCGSLGYIGCDGSMDFNILIRSVTAQNGWWQIPVGGGIVSDSVPETEYDETWAKASGMLRAVSRIRNRRNHIHSSIGSP